MMHAINFEKIKARAVSNYTPVIQPGFILPFGTESKYFNKEDAEKYGYGVVRDLCGHGVGLAFHEDPEVMHIGHRNTGMLLVPGMVFTIEPMINQGTWEVFIDADDEYGWEVITGDELPSAQWEHTFLMTEHGVEILTY